MEAAGWGRWQSHTVQSSPVMDVDGGGLPDGWNVTACARGWSQAGESLHHGRLGASPTRQRGGFGEAWRDRSAAGVGRSTENRRTRAGPNVAPGTWAALEGMRILAGTSVSGRPTTCCMQRREFGWQPQVRVETGPPAGQEDEAHRARRSSRSSRPSVTPIRLIAHHVSSVSQTPPATDGAAGAGGPTGSRRRRVDGLRIARMYVWTSPGLPCRRRNAS